MKQNAKKKTAKDTKAVPIAKTRNRKKRKKGEDLSQSPEDEFEETVPKKERAKKTRKEKKTKVSKEQRVKISINKVENNNINNTNHINETNQENNINNKEKTQGRNSIDSPESGPTTDLARKYGKKAWLLKFQQEEQNKPETTELVQAASPVIQEPSVNPLQLPENTENKSEIITPILHESNNVEENIFNIQQEVPTTDMQIITPETHLKIEQPLSELPVNPDTTETKNIETIINTTNPSEEITTQEETSPLTKTSPPQLVLQEQALAQIDVATVPNVEQSRETFDSNFQEQRDSTPLLPQMQQINQEVPDERQLHQRNMINSSWTNGNAFIQPPTHHAQQLSLLPRFPVYTPFSQLQIFDPTYYGHGVDRGERKFREDRGSYRGREVREIRDPRERGPTRDSRDVRNMRDKDTRLRDSREYRDYRDFPYRDVRDGRDMRDSRDRDMRDMRDRDRDRDYNRSFNYFRDSRDGKDRDIRDKDPRDRDFRDRDYRNVRDSRDGWRYGSRSKRNREEERDLRDSKEEYESSLIFGGKSAIADDFDDG